MTVIMTDIPPKGRNEATYVLVVKITYVLLSFTWRAVLLIGNCIEFYQYLSRWSLFNPEIFRSLKWLYSVIWKLKCGCVISTIANVGSCTWCCTTVSRYIKQLFVPHSDADSTVCWSAPFPFTTDNLRALLGKAFLSYCDINIVIEVVLVITNINVFVCVCVFHRFHQTIPRER